MSIILADGQYTAVTEDVNLLPVPGKQYYYKNIGTSKITITYGANTQFLEADELGIWVYDGTYWSDLTPKTDSFSSITMDDGETYQLADRLTHVHVTADTGSKTITLQASPNDGDAANVYVTGDYDVSVVGVGAEALIADSDNPVRVETVSGTLQEVKTGGGGAGTSVSVYNVDFEVLATDRFIIAVDDDGNIVKGDKSYSEVVANKYKALGIVSDAKATPVIPDSSPDNWTDGNTTIVSSDIGDITITSAYEGDSTIYATCTLSNSYSPGSTINFNLDTNNDIAVGYSGLVDRVILNADGTYTDGTDISVSSYTAVGAGTYNVELIVNTSFSNLTVGNWVGGENEIALTDILITEAVPETYEITVQKIALLEGFTGLTIGEPVYLGTDGGYTQDINDIAFNEFEVIVGYAVSTTSVDIQLTAPKQNIEDTLTPRVTQNEVDIAENTTNIDAILSGTSQSLLGQEVVLPYSEDLSQYGLLQYTFETVSTSRYPEWYAKIGDTFEQQHLDAGQPASGAGYFYPTPVPGAYGRSALPDIEFTDSEINVSNTTMISLSVTNWNDYARIGTAVIFKVVSGTAPTGLTDGTTYYVKSQSDDTIRVYSSESDAISDASPLTVSDSGSGSFKLTQEGLSLEDAFQGHYHNAQIDGSSAGVSLEGASGSAKWIVDTSPSNQLRIANPITDGNNGTPRTSNETRPDTTIKFYYTKVENVIPFVGEPVSGVKYDTGWVEKSDWTVSNITVNHNLDDSILNLNYRFYVSQTGSDSDALEALHSSLITTSLPATATEDGLSAVQLDANNFTLVIGSSGFLFVTSAGTLRRLDTESWYYRVIVEKKNYSSPILDQPKYTNQTYTLGDGDSISLTAQKTIILVDSTTADMSIDITGYAYNGQDLIIKNIGTANKCTITNNIGGWLKDATLQYGQSSRAEIANDELTEGDFVFIWDIDSEIGYENSWVNFETTRKGAIVYRNKEVSLRGLIKNGTLNLVAFTIPEAIRPIDDSTKSFTGVQNGAFGRIALSFGEVRPQTNNASVYLDGISWTAKG